MYPYDRVVQGETNF